ncbi:lactonase family protein [Streptomyces sp. NPDC088725]|uniref:lactonase family protein n=1 Tax=Streptomyces sp. NPDC088725 TaxID=3365873 RepID=UPI00380A1797
MKNSLKPARTARFALAAAASLATLVVPATAQSAQRSSLSGTAVFVQTDNTGGNQIVAYHRAPDGSLHRTETYGTGGRGGVLTGSVVDHLASQGSLAYDRAHHLLYAVNAGSDTITVFSVDGERLHREQIISSGGTFPVSVTVHEDRVYVLNARKGGAIQGYRLTDHGLRLIEPWHRPLRLDTATAPEFLHTPGQVSFTPDGTQLVVTTKSGGNSIEVFNLSRSGAPSDRPAVNSKEGSVPFGVTFDAHSRLVVADTGPNAVLTFRLHRDGEAELVDDIPTAQQASCWIVRAGDRFYVSNAGSDSLSGYRQTHGAHLASLGNTPTSPGTVDTAVTPDGRFLYAQTGGKGIVDAFRVNPDGTLTRIGTTTVPDAVGGEGIVAL